MKDALLTRVNFVKHHVGVDLVCPCCRDGYETCNYLFLDCEVAWLVWKLSPFRFVTWER